jgi:ankyrin repeat protein
MTLTRNRHGARQERRQNFLCGLCVLCGLMWLPSIAFGAQAPNEKADALSEAARKGDAAAVKKLLDEGVDINTKFRYNRTALSFAADRGHVEVVKLLLDRGADVNVKDTFYSATPLTWAVNPAMGRTPQHAEVVRLLLQHGAQGKEDALRAAAARGEADTTKVILGLGGLAPAALSDALEAATKGKHADVVALLEQAGAKPRPEVKLDPAQLARYVGSYKGTGNMAQMTVTIAIADGHLTATFGGPPMALIARDETTFAVSEQPGSTVTFKIDQDKATSMTVNAGGNAMALTRVE